MNRPVLISGAGPTGLFLAGELAVAGVETVVLERAEKQPDDDNRTGTFHARSAELFDHRGLLDELLADGPPQWRRIHFGHLWLDLEKEPDQFFYLVDQLKVERQLERWATGHGADVRRGHEVLEVRQDPDGVTVRVGYAGGEYELRGEYLVGADGRDSLVRELAGFDAVRSGPTWYGVLGDITHYEGQFEVEVYPGGLFGALPDGAGNFRIQTIEFGVEPPAEDAPVTIEELAANIARVTGEARPVADPRWLRRYTGIDILAGSYRSGRVFLAGDAAHHYFFPAGHNLNTNFHDAANLGWKLAAAVRGWAPEGLLDTYHAERRPVGGRASLSTQAQLALAHPLAQVGPLRKLFAELTKYDAVNSHLIKIITEVVYPMVYPGSAPDAERHPLQGRQLPVFDLKTAGGEHESTRTLLRGGAGALIDLSGNGSEARDLAAGWAGRVEVVAAQPVPGVDAGLLLVRPDAYVAWADAGHTDLEGLRTALTTWFGAPAAG